MGGAQMSTDKSICRTDEERAARHVAIGENYQLFIEKLLPDLLKSHPGEWALLRKGALVEVFPTSEACCEYARKHMEDCLWSVQEITDAEVDEGWYSYTITTDEP